MNKMYKNLNPAKARDLIRSNNWKSSTAGISLGFAQANFICLPKKFSFEFITFCQRNSIACPILEIIEPGQTSPSLVAKKSDLRTDLPKYLIYKRGELIDEVTDIMSFWNDDLVSILLGCSFTVDNSLLKAGIPIRHIEQGSSDSMYITNIECHRSGSFYGKLIVSMRPIPKSLVKKAVNISSQYILAHGEPIQIGSPKAIGIKDISKPDYGDPVPVNDGEIPVFWACGVTSQLAVLKANVEFFICHKPGHMFITDLTDNQLKSIQPWKY